MKKSFLTVIFVCILALTNAYSAPEYIVVDNGGSGPYSAEALSDPSLPGFVVYRPQNLEIAVDNSGPLPLVVFANGACLDSSKEYERMFTDLASYGYIIVALGELIQDGADRPLSKTDNADMIKALDWAFEQNALDTSEYFQSIDTEYVAFAGHSCGGAQLLAMAAEPRVKTYVMLNSGIGNMEMADATKESLKNLHGPIIYMVGGESDVAYPNALIDYDAIDHVPVVFANHPTAGHGGTFADEYGGAFSELLRTWLNWQFKGQRHQLSTFITPRSDSASPWEIKAKNFLTGDVNYEMPKFEPAKRPKFDSENPWVHDPVMACEDGKYYMFTTGMGIGLMVSEDGMKTWKPLDSPLNPIPQWAQELVPAYKGHTWAPDIIKVGDNWYLYYSCSTFGKNISVIGVMTSPYLDPSKAKWTDLGMVVRSQPGITDWNAIDPNVIVDEQGNPWLTFGSFWDGIQLVQLDKDMKTLKGEPRTIARRRCPCVVAHMQEKANTNAIEAPFILKHGDYYYLFVSYDYCCQGLASNYKTAVGRSKTVDGPYLDINGEDMADTGGTIIIAETPRYAGVGHCSVYDFDGTTYFIAHAYDKQQHGASKLFIRPITWTPDAWPSLQ